MGLVVNLYREIYIGAYFRCNEVSGIINIQRQRKNVHIELGKIESINTLVSKWHKCPPIHNWFVEHVASGVQDCKKYEVSPEQLAEFKEFCLSEQKRLAMTCTDSDAIADYSWELRETLKALKALPLDDDSTYFFQASF